MAEDKEALLQHYRKTRLELLAAMDGLSDESLVEPAIDGWSVKDHLAHVALWDDLRASEVARISAGHESAWRTTEEQGGAYNALGYELRLGLSLEQVRWELDDSRRRLLAAIATASARGLDGALYGEAALRSDHEAEHTEWLKR
ncbi:MAG: DinB family protein, partial [Anaerolineaceae bacterium]